MDDEGIFEIREYLDEEGNEIRSEKINMQQAADEVRASVPEMLERVREAQRRKGGGGDDDSGNSGTTTSAGGGAQSSQDWASFEKKVEALHLEEEKWKRSQEESQASRSTLQGSGWKTGFLCGSLPTTSSKSGPHLGTTPTKSAIKKVSSDDEHHGRRRSVSFDVRETEETGGSGGTAASSSMTASPSSLGASRPMAFTGMVTERGMDGSGDGGRATTMESPQEHASVFRQHRMQFDHREFVPHNTKSEE